VLFAVLARRHGDHGMRAMLLARDQAAAALVAAKIPHYGRYSELLFATGRNLVKSTREPAVSPLRIPFDAEQGP
jgi:hypothetical protein